MQAHPARSAGTVRVPLDYRRPDGPGVEIHVSQVRASGHLRGVLVINEGGPGPHLADASAFGGLAPRSLPAVYDVISFDQRGFGRCASVSCGLSPQEQAEIPPWPQRDGEPASPVQARRVAAKCAARAGGEMPFLGTANVALGISYGSYLGAAYASMYPQHTDRTFLNVVRLRDRDPLDTPVGAVAGTQLRIGLFASMYSDAVGAARAGEELQVWFSDENTAAGQLGVFCADRRWTRSVARYDREARIDARRYPLTGGAGSSIWPCAFWPSDPIDPPVRAVDRGPDNILLINNLHDPVTTYADALSLRRQFGDRARLVGVDHGGHGSYLLAGNMCANQAGTAFLLGGPLAAHDFTCPANSAGPAGPSAHAGLWAGASVPGGSTTARSFKEIIYNERTVAQPTVT